ncbi:hypothetical protein FRC03_010217, partial [Tulasnella sp. 419]
QTRQGSIRLASIAIAIVHTWSGFNTIIWESAVVIPKIGVQLEVQRGFPETFITPAILWSRSRRFIPLSSMLDIVINEGIRRWDFKYYLMITHRVPPQRSNDEYIKIAVAFEDTLPPFPVLREVYHGLREALFNEFEIPETELPSSGDMQK